MTEAQATDAVRSILYSINRHPRRDVRVPHGFEVSTIQAEKVSNPFAEALIHWKVTVRLEVPVLYSLDPSPCSEPRCPPRATTSTH